MANSASAATVEKRRPPNLFLMILAAILLIALAGLAAFVAGRTLRPYQIKGTQLEPARPAANFSMISSDTGQPVSLDDFQDKFIFLYFGYTACPDVCPATLSDYTRAYNLMTQDTRDHVKFLWITVDPERDSPEEMAEYTSHFVPGFMTGLVPQSEDELAATATAYASYYEKVDVGSQAGYLMDHSAGVALIDPQGTWRIIYSFNTPPEDIAADLDYLVKTETN